METRKTLMRQMCAMNCKAIARRVPSNSSPKDVKHLIYASALSDDVPDVCIALLILLITSRFCAQ